MWKWFEVCWFFVIFMFACSGKNVKPINRIYSYFLYRAWGGACVCPYIILSTKVTRIALKWICNVAQKVVLRLVLNWCNRVCYYIGRDCCVFIVYAHRTHTVRHYPVEYNLSNNYANVSRTWGRWKVRFCTLSLSLSLYSRGCENQLNTHRFFTKPRPIVISCIVCFPYFFYWYWYALFI